MTVVGDCVVTGVTGGLGAHAAVALANDGWRVIGIGRKPPDHEDIPRGISYIQADLGSSVELAALPKRLAFCPDLFVHSAVMYPHLNEDGTGSIEEIFRVNAFAPYQLSLDLLALKPDTQLASFVVLNSEVVFNADDVSGVYAASKAALRVLTSALAHVCRGRHASASTLLLGPLANKEKRRELAQIAARRGVSEQEITRQFLRKSNSNLVIEDLIEFDACVASIRFIRALGVVANGMVCRLDGGAAGSLI